MMLNTLIGCIFCVISLSMIIESQALERFDGIGLSKSPMVDYEITKRFMGGENTYSPWTGKRSQVPSKKQKRSAMEEGEIFLPWTGKRHYWPTLPLSDNENNNYEIKRDFAWDRLKKSKYNWDRMRRAMSIVDKLRERRRNNSSKSKYNWDRL